MTVVSAKWYEGDDIGKLTGDRKDKKRTGKEEDRMGEKFVNVSVLFDSDRLTARQYGELLDIWDEVSEQNFYKVTAEIKWLYVRAEELNEIDRRFTDYVKAHMELADVLTLKVENEECPEEDIAFPGGD